MKLSVNELEQIVLLSTKSIIKDYEEIKDLRQQIGDAANIITDYKGLVEKLEKDLLDANIKIVELSSGRN
jgi:cytoplasmic iron level regulating protein YaaA (DUF328/UPF0246 family)